MATPTPDIAGSTADAWRDVGPSTPVLISGLGVIGPLLFTGFVVIALKGFLVSMGFGIISGVATMAVLYYAQKRRSDDRRQQAATIAAMSHLDRAQIQQLLPNEDLPSWVSYPSYEKVEWLNKQLKEVWPYLNKATCATIRESLTPTLEAYKVGIIKGIKVKSLTLGNVGPRFGGVRTIKTGEDEVTLEAEVDWRQGRDQKLVLSVDTAIGAKLAVQVKDIRFYGVIKAVFKPLVAEVPGFGAVLFALKDQPSIDMDIGLAGGDITAIPGIEKMIDNIIKTALNDMLVWPSRMVFPMMPGDFSWLELKPIGYLEVVIHEGTQIPKTDFIGKTDPFIYLYVRQKEGLIRRTSTKMNNMKPVWNEKFFIEVEDLSAQSLMVRLMDDETVEKSEYVGSRKYPLNELKQNELQDIWLEMVEDPELPKEGKKRGLIHISLTFHPYFDEDDIKYSPCKKPRKKRSDKDGDGEPAGDASTTKQDDGDHGGKLGIRHVVKKVTSKVMTTAGLGHAGGNKLQAGEPDPSKIVGDHETSNEGHTGKVPKSGGSGF